MNSKPVGATGNGGGGAEDYILIREEQPSGTNGGTFTQDVWQTRVFNTKVNDDGNHASLSSNQITLDAGTYRVRSNCPAAYVNRHKAKLYNITDSVDIIIGSSEFAHSTFFGLSSSCTEGRFILATPKIIEVQHRCSQTRTNTGFGQPSSFGVIEVYSSIEFWREA